MLGEKTIRRTSQDMWDISHYFERLQFDDGKDLQRTRGNVGKSSLYGRRSNMYTISVVNMRDAMMKRSLSYRTSLTSQGMTYPRGRL